MKKKLSILCTITLIGTSTINLLACHNITEYTPEELTKLKEENKINTKNQTIKDNLEGIASQEKPFNKIDNKYYFVVWRGAINDGGRIVNFKHTELKIGKIFDKFNNYTLELREETGYPFYFTLYLRYSSSGAPADGEYYNKKYFKSVYRGNGENQNLPKLYIDENGNVKVNE